jgi:hypothetical protein
MIRSPKPKAHKMRGGRQYGNKKRTRADMRAAALQMLTFRASLDGLTPEQLSRSYGLSLPDATDLLNKEVQRRRNR